MTTLTSTLPCDECAKNRFVCHPKNKCKYIYTHTDTTLPMYVCITHILSACCHRSLPLPCPIPCVPASSLEGVPARVVQHNVANSDFQLYSFNIWLLTLPSSIYRIHTHFYTHTHTHRVQPHYHPPLAFACCCHLARTSASTALLTFIARTFSTLPPEPKMALERGLWGAINCVCSSGDKAVVSAIWESDNTISIAYYY